MLRTSLYLSAFWAMQAVAQLLFKWGSLEESRWWLGFLGGNAFGFTSIWLLMLVYRAIAPGLALALATAGAFVLGQLAVSVVFKTPLLPMQWFGVGMIVLGVTVLALNGAGEA